ncbi:flavodoxin family protein [Terribacillus saccharophilus]|uniref:flavodoxin family protein n=1 Tax=Terribacillus saccharophilus TaxID=361277 RepID=UPI003981EF76
MAIGLILGTSRTKSNSRILADALLKGTEHQILDINEISLLDFEDSRHESVPVSLDESSQTLMNFLLEHNVIVIATPIYWYGIPGKLKVLLDRLSHVFRQPDFKKQKPREVIILAVGGDQPRIKGLPLILQFQHIFDFVDIPFQHYVLAEGNKPGDVSYDQRALAEVAWLREYMMKRENYEGQI